MKANSNFSDLKNLLNSITGKAFVLCDENTYKYCYQSFCEQIGQQLQTIVLPSGEETKSMAYCEYIWKQLLQEQAAKDALLINLGGGVITDIGGFAAATYKRGINYVNVPTSLLAMVDAASGGKTGINFEHFKNIIGVIQQPALVLVYIPFLRTLPTAHIKNGFAEMLKHALLSSREEVEAMLSSTEFPPLLNEASILKNLAVKEAIVAKDPNEKGLRKVLNLGHTVGHAIEYVAQENGYEILHGEAVVIGLIAALNLSVSKLNFSKTEADSIIQFIRLHYPTPTWLKEHHSALIDAIQQDKKNAHQSIRMVLLEELGKPVYDVVCSKEEILMVLGDIF
jgi:3-dehydroquinate synthase